MKNMTTFYQKIQIFDLESAFYDQNDRWVTIINVFLINFCNFLTEKWNLYWIYFKNLQKNIKNYKNFNKNK